MYQTEFDVYQNYVVYLHVNHVRSCSPTPTYKQPLYGCQPDEPQASLTNTNRCNHVYVVLFIILLFMYAVIHCLYFVGNKLTTSTTLLAKRVTFVRLILSCDQEALWMDQSVRPSGRLSVCLSHLFDYVPIIVMSMQQVKVRGRKWRSQRSKLAVA